MKREAKFVINHLSLCALMVISALMLMVNDVVTAFLHEPFRC